MTDTRELATTLRSEGHKLTNQRIEVWRVLSGAAGHLTAEEVTARCEPKVNQASVYRTLSLFNDLGLARESRLGPDGASRWEVAHPDDVFHLVCTECRRVEHHGGQLVDEIRNHLGSAHHFVADAVELSVRGRCGTCSAGTAPYTPAS